MSQSFTRACKRAAIISFDPTSKLTLTAERLHAASLLVLSAWTLHSFRLPLPVACATAIASWPLYEWCASRLPRRMEQSATSLAFTSLITVFALVLMTIVLGAILTQTRTPLSEMAAIDEAGIALPSWFPNPLAGFWLERWIRNLARPGGFDRWMQQTGATLLLAWLQSLGQFVSRRAHRLRCMLRHRLGERAGAYV